MMNKSKEEINKEIHEAAVKLFNSQEIPAELYYACHQIYWLHTIPTIDVENAIKYVWSMAQYRDYKLHPVTFINMIKKVEEGLTSEMEWINESLISEEEHKLRKKAIELLINIVCEVTVVKDLYTYVYPVRNREVMVERINKYKNDPKYANMFKYKSRDAIFFSKFYEQYKAGVPLDKIKVNQKEVDDEYNDKVVSNVMAVDKRVRNRNIEMILVDTDEVVQVFSTRAECIEKTGITKSRLSQCLNSSRDPHRCYWHKWKEKTGGKDGKKYYFHEVYK